MKDNLGSDYFLLAHVDVGRVHYRKGEEFRIEFINEIDAWSKIAFKFRGAKRKNFKYARNDLESLVYGFKSTVDK